MRKGQAQQIFIEELEKVYFPTDYNDFSVRDEAFRGGWKLEHWRELDIGQGDTARNLAYFRAYLRIAKDGGPISVGDPLPAGGLRLEPKGRIWMDRYIIGKMHGRGFLRFEDDPGYRGEPAFFLTEAGKMWVDDQ